MIALKLVSAATLLTLAASCQSSGSRDSEGQSRFARHEAVSRTYSNGNSVEAPERWSALANDDTSRTYTSGGPLESDDLSLRGYNDDSSRTYHGSGVTTINQHGAYVEEAKAKHSDAHGFYYSIPESDAVDTAPAKH